MAFFELIRHDNLDYLRKAALLKGYRFMGLGLEPGEPYNTSCTDFFAFIFGIKVIVYN
jgi:hypothetical protein